MINQHQTKTDILRAGKQVAWLQTPAGSGDVLDSNLEVQIQKLITYSVNHRGHRAHNKLVVWYILFVAGILKSGIYSIYMHTHKIFLTFKFSAVMAVRSVAINSFNVRRYITMALTCTWRDVIYEGSASRILTAHRNGALANSASFSRWI